MYYYILDPHNLSLNKFEQLQVQLQGLLAEFNVSGEIGRVTALRSMNDLIETASNRGVKTLVACGNDDTFNLMLALLKGRDFTLGFIPFDQSSYLAKILGIDSLYTAVKTIAARRIERMDLARIEQLQTYFLSYLEFGISTDQLKQLGWWNSLKVLSTSGQTVTIKIDDSYTVAIKCLGGLIANTRSTHCSDARIANPTDGLLDLLLLESLNKLDILKHKQAILEGCFEQIPNTTIIKCKKIEFIEPRGLALSLAGRIITKFPAKIEVIPERLRMIVGKQRTF